MGPEEGVALQVGGARGRHGFRGGVHLVLGEDHRHRRHRQHRGRESARFSVEALRRHHPVEEAPLLGFARAEAAVREPSHAGSAYPADVEQMRQTMEQYMDGAAAMAKANGDLFAIAAPIWPALSSRKTVVESTSVFMRVAPQKIKIGPNSPSDFAQASVPAVRRPRRASGNVTYQNACPRPQPSVIATCSFRRGI